MTQEEPAKPPLGPLERLALRIGAILALILVLILLDRLQDPLRDRWTYCFNDPVPARVDAQLALAQDALAQGDKPAALAAATRGHEMLNAAIERRALKYPADADQEAPPGLEARYETSLLKLLVRDYRRHCYPIPPLGWFR